MFPGTLSRNDRFHGIDPHGLSRSINQAVMDGRLTQTDAGLISAFIAERKITHGIGIKRGMKISAALTTVRRFVPPYNELNAGSLYYGIEQIYHADSDRGKPFSVHSQSDLISILKLFCFWLTANNEIQIPENKIRAIKVPKGTPTRTAADLLTGDEIQAMLETCLNSRDRAMFLIMYEGGLRVGEIGQMKWGDIKIDGTGLVLNVKFKTDKPRYIWLVMSKEYLTKWKSDYPVEIKEDALVFLNEHSKPITRAAIARQMERLAHRAGITKHIFPHIFRHSRITHLIQQGVGESVIKLMMWGSLKTTEFDTYAHLTGTDIDREIFKLYGVEASASQISASENVEPRICIYCNEINAPISEYCHVCGHPLTEESGAELDEFRSYMKKNRRLLLKFFQENMSDDE